MPVPVLLAVSSAGCFVALAHAAVSSPRPAFTRVTAAMLAAAALLFLVSPLAGAAMLAPVLLSRRLANAPVPATVPELLERYPSSR
jgi:ABC-type transport system involved in cytochrome c biogenesis permease subunit